MWEEGEGGGRLDREERAKRGARHLSRYSPFQRGRGEKEEFCKEQRKESRRSGRRTREKGGETRRSRRWEEKRAPNTRDAFRLPELQRVSFPIVRRCCKAFSRPLTVTIRGARSVETARRKGSFWSVRAREAATPLQGRFRSRRDQYRTEGVAHRLRNSLFRLAKVEVRRAFRRFLNYPCSSELGKRRSQPPYACVGRLRSGSCCVWVRKCRRLSRQISKIRTWASSVRVRALA